MTGLGATAGVAGEAGHERRTQDDDIDRHEDRALPRAEKDQNAHSEFFQHVG